MVISIIPLSVVTVSAANTADSLVAIAEGELGNTNYTKYYGGNAGAWCADFVTWCAQQAGVSSITNSSSCYYMYVGMTENNHCQEVSSPQKGDIVFFYCNSCSGTTNKWCHVGIMVNSTTSIDGNYGGKVSYDSSYSHYGSLGYKHSSGIRKIYVRPNYSNTPNNFPGEEDKSYNVPVWKTANSKLDTYNSNGNKESGRWIDAGDNCYIEKVYKNGYAWVKYPTSNGDRWAYTTASGFSLDKKQTKPIGTQTISDGEYHIVSALDNNKALDVSGGSLDDNANINLYSNLSDEVQVFKVTYIGNGYYKIINKHSNKCLDVQGGNVSPGANVCQYGDNGTDAQQWVIRESGDSTYFNIISKCNGLFLDVDDASTKNGTNIKTYSQNGSNAQKWKFIAWGNSTGQTITDGDYHISTMLDETKGLDAYCGQTENGTNIDIYANLNDKMQVFSVKYLGDGYYIITHKMSNKSLDCDAAKTIIGTNVQLYTYNGVDQQKWIIKESVDDDSYNIISKNSGLYLDVENGVSKDFTNVQLYIGNNTNAQKWKFISCNIIGDINADGNVNILDATMIQKHSAELELLDDNLCKYADVNGDGKADIIDATLIQKYSAELITQF